jgi:hypothetical protein
LAAFGEAGHQSVRKLAKIYGLGKDQVQRALNALKRKRVYSEAELWESPLAQEWLRRLLVAVIVTFMLEGGVGAERVSVFLRRARLDREIAASPTALRTYIKELEGLLARYGKIQEDAQQGKLKQLVVGADETFFRELLILVLMELSSGYILLEETCPEPVEGAAMTGVSGLGGKRCRNAWKSWAAKFACSPVTATRHW